MHPFSPLEKTDDAPLANSPLLPTTGGNDSSATFPLRIKLNNTDYSLNVNGSATVGMLKRWILECHANSETAANNQYLRLIVRGRLMAPDAATLESFSIVSTDVVHAVLAKEGRGAQARMLRRLNGGNANGNGVNIRRNFYGNSTNSDSLNRLWRRIGIDASGVVISRNEETQETDSEESEDDDVESARDGEDGAGRGRERQGFDRLRSTGMSRDEVNIIRSYFARSVDRYIERRRILIRASTQLRNSLGGENANAASNTGSTRERSDTVDSTNSLLDESDGSAEGANANTSESNNDNNQGNLDVESGNVTSVANNDSITSNTAVEGEDILMDRRRMEDEWMSTQGPYSEFRMNLNTSNPLLLAAISGNNNNPSLSNILPGTNRRGRGLGAGLFFRRNNGGGTANNVTLDSEEDDGDVFGSLGPNPMLLPNSNSAFHPYMGPLPSAGTDKDLMWGFILGFFVGFIMLFWVWMPTVPHKQKIGIISGVICQLGLNLLRKSGAGDVSI